jgi:hypothetical protein
VRGRMAVDSYDEVGATLTREGLPSQHSKHLTTRRSEGEDDSEVNIEDEDSKFSASLSDEDMEQGTDSWSPRPPSNQPQLRHKPSIKSSKGKTGRKVRRAVISDDDDDDDSMPWRSDTADDDPPSSPPPAQVTVSSNTRTQKGKSKADFEDVDSLKRDRIGTKRPRPLDFDPTVDTKSASPPTGLDVNVAVENKEPPLKKKLPPIKKIKLSDSAAPSPMPASKATPAMAKMEKPKLTVDSTGLPPPPSSLPRKPAATAGNADLDLSNADVYKQLFSVSS